MTEIQKALAVLGAGLAVVAVLWIAAIGPKRGERSEVRDRVSAAEQRLDTLRTEVAGYERAKAGFAEMAAQLRRLDVAVPAKGELASLLRGLQRRADSRGVQLRLALLKDPAPTAADPSAAPGAAAAPATPGATPGPAGLSQLPFRLTFTGEYFELLRVLATVRDAVRAGADDDELDVRGRLLTIDGLSLRRPQRGSPVTTATLSATAYVAPEQPVAPTAQEVADAAAPPPAAAVPTSGGS